MKIIHLITDLDMGGAEMMLSKLVQKMDDTKFQNVIISMMGKQTPIAAELEKNGFKIYSLGMQQSRLSLYAMKRLLEILRQENPDILQTWMYHADLLGLIAKTRYKTCKLVWNIRCSNMDLGSYSKLTTIVIKLCAAFSKIPDAIIVNSQAGMSLHKEMGYKPRSWQLIFNGFELQKYRPVLQEEKRFYRIKKGYSEDTRLIGHVARYDVMKDHKSFIKAIDILVHELNIENINCLLIGKNVDEQNPELTYLISQKKLGKYIALMAQRDDVADIVPNLDIFVSSSLGEGFSNVIGEAMACGVPCIATDVGDSRNLIQNLGIIVPPKNPEELANGMKQMLQMDRQQFSILQDEVRKHIEQNYSIKKIVGDYERLYETLLNNRV